MPHSDHILIRRREYDRIMAVVKAAERAPRSLVAQSAPLVGGGGAYFLAAFITGNQTVEEVVQHSWQAAKWDADASKLVQDSDGFCSTVGADTFGRPACNSLNPAAVCPTGTLVFLRHGQARTALRETQGAGHYIGAYFWFHPTGRGVHRAKITTVVAGTPAGYNASYDAAGIDDPSITVVGAVPVDRRPAAAYINWHNKSTGDLVMLVEDEDGSLVMHAWEQPHVEACDDHVYLADLTDVEIGLSPGEGDLLSLIGGVWQDASIPELGIMRVAHIDTWDGPGNMVLTAVPATVPMNTVRINSDEDLFSHDAGEVTVAEARTGLVGGRLTVGIEGDPLDSEYQVAAGIYVDGVLVVATTVYGGSQ